MTIIGYFDESGHSGSTDFVSIAAFAAEEATWSVFDASWRSLLRTVDAPYLHMREFAHSQGPFKGWAEERRRELLAGAVGLINDARLVAIGTAMSVADFRSLTDEEQTMFQDPFYSCFQEVARGVAIHAEGTPDDAARMIFSQQDDLGPMLKKLWASLIVSSDLREQMKSLEFQDMRDTPGLQAADLLAYELRHFYDSEQKRPGAISRWPFRTLVAHQRQVLGARMLKYLPLWYMQLPATGAFDEAMGQMMKYPGAFLPLLLQLTPNPR